MGIRSINNGVEEIESVHASLLTNQTRFNSKLESIKSNLKANSERFENKLEAIEGKHTLYYTTVNKNVQESRRFREKPKLSQSAPDGEN